MTPILGFVMGFLVALHHRSRSQLLFMHEKKKNIATVIEDGTKAYSFGKYPKDPRP